MSPAQIIATERTAEKCLDKQVQSKQTLKHKLGDRTNGWSKVEAGVRCPSSKKQFKHQRQQRQRQRRLKNDLYSAYESRENLDSFSLSILSEICKTTSNSKEKF